MNITHFTSVQLRVVGVGNLRMKLISLDEVQERIMVPIVMTPTARRYPVALTNFSQHRAQLEIRINEIDENFVIGEIILFTKPIYTSYPQ